MIKDYFINSIENALENAVKNGKLGSMTEYERGTLKPERPKNAEFGDYAVNVSSLARFAKIAPPQIANAIKKTMNIRLSAVLLTLKQEINFYRI